MGDVPQTQSRDHLFLGMVRRRSPPETRRPSKRAKVARCLSSLPAELVCKILDHASLPSWCALACTSRQHDALTNGHATACCRRLGFSGDMTMGGLKLLVNFSALSRWPPDGLVQGLLLQKKKTLLQHVIENLRLPRNTDFLTCTFHAILVAMDASPNALNQPPLLKCAVDMNDVQALRYLFEKISATSEFGHHQFRMDALQHVHRSMEALTFLIKNSGLTADEVRAARNVDGRPILCNFAARGAAILKCLVDGLQLTKDDLCAANHAVLSNACYYGRLDVVQYLFEIAGLTVKSSPDIEMPILLYMLNVAALRGHIHLIQYCFDPKGVVQLTRADVRTNHNTILLLTTAHGSLENLKTLVHLIGFEAEDIRADNCRVLKTAAAHQRTDHVMYFFEHFGLTIADVRANNNKLLRILSRHGNLNTAKYLFETVGLTPDDARMKDNIVLRNAASYGFLDFILYLIQRVGLNANDLRTDNNFVLRMVTRCYNGLSVVSCLFETLGFTIEDARANNNEALVNATRCAWLDTITYFFEKVKMTADDVRANNLQALNVAVHESRMGVVRYLIETANLTVGDVCAIDPGHLHHGITFVRQHLGGLEMARYLERIKFDASGSPRDPALTFRQVHALWEQEMFGEHSQ